MKILLFCPFARPQKYILSIVSEIRLLLHQSLQFLTIFCFFVLLQTLDAALCCKESYIIQARKFKSPNEGYEKDHYLQLRKETSFCALQLVSAFYLWQHCNLMT